jgi:GntR family transcriptional regulator, transcriptional repressor for pyruvate dehydrogenase complex
MDNSCEDVESTVQFDIAFHRALAASTHNELFLVLHDSMGEMLLEVRRRNLARGAERRRLVVEMHRRIRDAVSAHDPEAARLAMIDHLGAVQESWEQQAGI